MLAHLARPSVLAFAWPATVALALVLRLLAAEFETPAYGVVAFELAFHKATALWILEEWGPAGVRAFAWQTVVDCLWAPLYGMAIAGLAGRLWAGNTAPRAAVRPFMAAALLAAAFDLVENVGMLAFLALGAASPAWLSAGFALAAAAKFALLVLALLPVAAAVVLAPLRLARG